MKSQMIDAADGSRTYALVFGEGDEVVSQLTAFAEYEGLTAGSFKGIGAFRDVCFGYFDWERKKYEEIVLDEQVEVLSLLGDVATKDGEPKIHAHAVVGKRDATAHGGHLLRAHVRPTLELVLEEAAAHLRKRHDDETGLALIDLDAVAAKGGDDE